jgi:carbamoyl-phosphate synthase small subunit
VTDRPAFVLLEDGAWFAGHSARPFPPAFGEVVFTTNLTGYQETFTDPSYLGQIVVMTAPMMGNYGVNEEDMESPQPQVSGVVVRELSRHPSSWRATRSLDDWLSSAGIPVLEGIDTRRLTRHLRERGVMRGVVAEGHSPSAELRSQLLESPSMEGLDLASRASTSTRSTVGSGPHVVAYDFGMKRNIVRMLVAAGCRVTVVPAATSAAEVHTLKPDGIFLSNGPGDPAAVGYALDTIRQLSGSGLPTFGICLGHQLIGLAYGGSTAKLPYGHRGGNHPVRDLRTDQVLITTQNHGFAVVGNQ